MMAVVGLTTSHLNGAELNLGSSDPMECFPLTSRFGFLFGIELGITSLAFQWILELSSRDPNPISQS